MLKKVLMAFDDPGGGLAVSSLIEILIKNQKFQLEIFSGKLSEKFLKGRNINYNKIDSQIIKSDAEKIIGEYKPDILITGTGGGNAEQELRNIAYDKNIKSVVILDFWKDYSRRWLYATYPADKMKDKVCVMDEMTKKEMIEDKFNPDNIIITGHPYLDRLFNYDRSDFNSAYYKNNISVFNKFLFLSQPLDIIGIKNYEVHPLKILINVLKKLAKENETQKSLTIKLHPSESRTSELKSLVSLNNSDEVEIFFAEENNSLTELISESEAVIGYNTIAMFESRAMYRRTISLNVVPVKNSLMKAMSEAGIEIVKADEEELYKCLSNNNFEKNILNQNIFKGGLNNCVKVILDELNC